MAASVKYIFPSIATKTCEGNVSTRSSNSYQDDILHHYHLSDNQKCIIIGEECSGKTALLFQYAVSLAHCGYRVTFITPSKFKSLPPAVEGAASHDPLLMKQINIVYFQDRLAVLSYLSGIHSRSLLPNAIIVDNLDYYTSHPPTGDTAANTSLLCAYLVDAASYISSKRGPSSDAGPGCPLMASVQGSSHGEIEVPDVYGIFLPSQLRIVGVNPKERIFQLTFHGNGRSTDCIITYQLGQTIKVLDVLKGAEASVFSHVGRETQDGDSER